MFKPNVTNYGINSVIAYDIGIANVCLGDLADSYILVFKA